MRRCKRGNDVLKRRAAEQDGIFCLHGRMGDIQPVHIGDDDESRAMTGGHHVESDQKRLNARLETAAGDQNDVEIDQSRKPRGGIADRHGIQYPVAQSLRQSRAMLRWCSRTVIVGKDKQRSALRLKEKLVPVARGGVESLALVMSAMSMADIRHDIESVHRG
jgi:hypothetical protein